MGSSTKTANLGLSKFIGAEKLVMGDYNNDMERIDEADGLNQKKSDSNLITPEKTVVGAINELAGSIYAPTEYGVRYLLGASSPIGERVKKIGSTITYGAATNLVAEMPVGNAAYANSFDDIIQQSKIQDAAGNWFSRFKKFYVRYQYTGGYIYIWMCYTKLPGYIPAQKFVKPGGAEAEYGDIGCYEASYDTAMRSIPGAFPKVVTTIANFRTYAAAAGYHQGDMADVELKQVLFQIEFATRNSQAIVKGVSELPYSASHTAALNETSVNRIVVATETAGLFVVGQTINIGTGAGSQTIAANRIVTAINAVDGSNSEIVFNGAPVSIAVGNVVSSGAWKTGSTDSILARSGILTANSGKYPFKWRDIENPFGNIYECVDGIGIVQTTVESVTTRKAYVCTDPAKHANITATTGSSGVATIPDGYSPVSYVDAAASGYAKELGYDESKPYCRLPIASAGSTSTYYCDYYYTSDNSVANAVETRVVFFGGCWDSTANAGLFSFYCYYAFSIASINIGSRLSKTPS